MKEIETSPKTGEQTKVVLSDTSNEFVYTITDQQGKIVLGINAHGDAVLNDVIARNIRNAEFGNLISAIKRMSGILSATTDLSNTNSLLISYLNDAIASLIINQSFNNYSLVTDYQDTHITSLTLLDLCPQTSTAGFCLYTTNDDDPYQYVAYYDLCHQLTVAMRHKTNGIWSNFTKVKLDSFVGDDGHNYIHMIVDNEGCLHVCANMHAVPLNYWRFTQPHSLDYYVKESMTNNNEDSVTYPFFIRLSDNRIMFAYRNGVSGSGNHYVNFLDNGKWKTNRLIFKGIISSTVNYSAYCCGMIGDFNGTIYDAYSGNYELFYLWRDDASPTTCCRLCYVKTQDFATFKTYNNNTVSLPIQYNNSTSGIILDDVASGGGLMNTYWRVLHTNGNGTLFCYHKYYNNNTTSQVYGILIKNGQKVGPVKITDWNLKLDIDDADFNFSLNMKEESNAFVVRCGLTKGNQGSTNRYYLNKSTLAVSSVAAAGADFFDYPSCIRTSLDNTANNSVWVIKEDINRSNILMKYEVPKSGMQILPTFLKIIEYT